jgi:hypothetical protein
VSFYDDHVLPRIINVVMDTKEARKIRSRVCAGLTGEVVEIGFGAGHSFPYLPPEVKRLRAVEPSQLAVRLARPRIAASPIAVEVAGLLTCAKRFVLALTARIVHVPDHGHRGIRFPDDSRGAHALAS